jgi:transcriptional regulator with XRE-family HTH domain
MTLAEWLRRKMKELGLNAKKIQERSGRTISDAYVLDIMRGKTKRPSVVKLHALAKGMGIDPDEIIGVARGMEVEGAWTPQGLVDAMGKVLASEELTLAVKSLLRMKPEELRRAVKYLNRG